jgi:hypothetical protein
MMHRLKPKIRGKMNLHVRRRSKPAEIRCLLGQIGQERVTQKQNYTYRNMLVSVNREIQYMVSFLIISKHETGAGKAMKINPFRGRTPGGKKPLR